MNQNKEEVVANGNQGKAAISKSNEKPGDVNNTKVLLNELNGKLVGVEVTKSNEKNDTMIIAKNNVSTKAASTELGKESKVVVNDAVKKSFTDLELVKNTSDDNTKSILQTANQTASDKKNLNSLFNEKLSGVEFKPAVAKDENVTITKDTVSTKQLSAEAVNDGKAIFNKTVNESSDEKDFAKYKTNDNLKGLPQSADLSAGTSEIDDKKILFTDLNGKLVGVDVKKTTAKEDNAKAIKENENTKLVSGDNAKENETAIKETENNSSDRKDSAKHKSNESFKNILQSADQINGNDSDKFKIAPELKTSPDVPKTIKTHEIIPEFTKIIRTGEKQSMTFQLTPENLGKVKLIVEMIDNHINTRIEVENEQVKQFIQSNVEQLKQNLQSSGIQLSSVNISLTESEQKFSKAFSQRKKSGERVSKVKINDEQARPTQKSLGYNTYEFLA
jgi:flagellar hook-length control protein FliK